MVFDRMGLRESATGRQFAFKYAFVDASENQKRFRFLNCTRFHPSFAHTPKSLWPSKRLPMFSFSPPMVNLTWTPVTLKKWKPSFSMRSTSLSAVMSRFPGGFEKERNVKRARLRKYTVRTKVYFEVARSCFLFWSPKIGLQSGRAKINCEKKCRNHRY